MVVVAGRSSKRVEVCSSSTRCTRRRVLLKIAFLVGVLKPLCLYFRLDLFTVVCAEVLLIFFKGKPTLWK